MTSKRWIVCLSIGLALMLALLAVLLLFTSRKYDPPLSDSARFVCVDAASHKNNLQG